MDEAEAFIEALRRDWGDGQANFDEFRFSTGLRPSEEIALVVSDHEPAHGTPDITKARVDGTDKDSTKTGDDRRIVLCLRAIAVLRRQLILRDRLARSGRIDHDHLFFKASGQPIRSLQYPGDAMAPNAESADEYPVPTPPRGQAHVRQSGLDDRT